MFRSLLLLLALSVPVKADPWKGYGFNKFGGVNLLQDSAMIDGDAVDAQNVLTDNTYLEKRNGNVYLATILAGSGGNYGNEWVSPSGTRYLVTQASNTIYQTNFAGAQTVLSTVAAGSVINVTPAFSKLYFADGTRNLWYWDGTSTATVKDTAGNLAPLCTYTAFKDNRLFCANIVNTESSQVDISSSGGANYWVMPANPATIDNAPNQFLFTPDDGDSITCLATTPFGMFVGKRLSSYLIKGTGNLTYTPRVLDPKIGCVDNRSVQMVYGVLVWLAVDGVYGFNGSGAPQLLTRELDPLMTQIRQGSFSVGAWSTLLQSDWQTGISTPSYPVNSWDNTSNPGIIFPSSVTIQYGTSSISVITNVSTQEAASGFPTLARATYSFTNGNFSLLNFNNWTNSNFLTPIHEGSVIGTACSAEAPSDTYSEVQPGSYGSMDAILTVKDPQGNTIKSCTSNFDGSCNFLSSTCDISVASGTVPGGSTLYQQGLNIANPSQYTGFVASITVSGCCNLTSSTFTASTNVTISLLCTGGATRRFGVKTCGTTNYGTSGSMVSTIYDTRMSTPTWGLFSATYTASDQNVNTQTVFNTRVSTSPNNDMWDAYVGSSDTVRLTNSAKRYAQFQTIFTSSMTGKTPSFTGLSYLAISTGIYYSKVNYIGTTITGWKTFSVSIATNTNPYNYYIRAATGTFTQLSSTPTWTATTSGQNITIATGSYVQYYFDSRPVTKAENAFPISAAFVYWNNGANIPVASSTINRRYMLCVTISTSATTPDTCLLRQKNNKWVFWTGPTVGAMGNYNGSMIAVDGSTNSKVWSILQPGVYNDDGAPINSYWITEDFVGDDPFKPQILHEMWADAVPVSASSMTFSYQSDKQAGWIDYTFTIDNGVAPSPSNYPAINAQAGTINKLIPLNAGTVQGKYIRAKISDTNMLNNYWRLNSYSLLIENAPRQIP